MAHYVVALSGGVDSAIVAYLLKQQQHQVRALFMRNWDEEPCSSREDLIHALAVADHLGIDLDVIDGIDLYRDQVFTPFLDFLQQGLTPNPDTLCNSQVKFTAMVEALHENETLATGHYAGVAYQQGRYQLFTAEDGRKDQSYFLYRLNQYQLSHSSFPLQGYLKEEVKQLAQQLKLPNADRHESMGICFIGERDFSQFISQYLPDTPGDMVNEHGQVMAQHRGLMHYTIGQRQGLGIGGAGLPWFVAEKQLESNRLVVVQGHDHPALYSNSIALTDTHWIDTPAQCHRVYNARVRHQGELYPCYMVEDSHHLRVVFSRPVWALAPGQALVIYDGKQCLGGGVMVK